MTAPRFSLLVPTRDRPVTLRYALHSLVVQSGSFEIVVADNASSPAVRAVVDEFAFHYPNVRYVRSDTLLPMGENWERGLAACSGEYVTVLGDDDALVPSALVCAERLIGATRTPLLGWATHTYWWPDTIVYWNANRLMVPFTSNKAAWHESRRVLKMFFDGQLDFGSLPMIYNAFVHRDLVQKVRERHGKYFHPVDMSPDVASGILNLLFTDRFVHSDRPLGVRGNSRASTGTATWCRHLGSERRAEYFREQGTTLADITDPGMIVSPNLVVAIANTKLRCKQAYFPDDAEFAVDPRRVLEDLLASLDREPEAYEENVADAKALAAKLGVDVAGRIPPRATVPRVRVQGAFGTPAAVQGVAVDCDAAGVFEVAAAARLADALTQPASSFLS